MKNILIDSHCHLNFPELKENLSYYLTEMYKNNILAALCVSTSSDNIAANVELVNQANITNNQIKLFASVGVHPDSNDDRELVNTTINKYIQEDNVIAVGETGLDYYHEGYDKIMQQDRFILHIDIAKRHNLPLIIHTRSASEDTKYLLKSHDASNGVMHCFTESIDDAKAFLDLGFYISLSGIVTFKSAIQIQELAKYIPIDRLLIETDAPFLAPVPFRGKINHPALLIYTAYMIAELRGITVADLAINTSKNFCKLFDVTI